MRAAIAKTGGEKKLRSIMAVQIEGVGHTYFIEQSERPEGPWIVNYEQSTELRDYSGQRRRRTTESRNLQQTEWSKGSTFVVADGSAANVAGDKLVAGFATEVVEAEELF